MQEGLAKLFKLGFDDFCFLTLTMIVVGSTGDCGMAPRWCSAKCKVANVS